MGWANHYLKDMPITHVVQSKPTGQVMTVSVQFLVVKQSLVLTAMEATLHSNTLYCCMKPCVTSKPCLLLQPPHPVGMAVLL